ncbi:retrovirus-related pol polyprotein from transposon TNT 1-94 [Tanacetum coccineum]
MGAGYWRRVRGWVRPDGVRHRGGGYRGGGGAAGWESGNIGGRGEPRAGTAWAATAKHGERGRGTSTGRGGGGGLGVGGGLAGREQEGAVVGGVGCYSVVGGWFGGGWVVGVGGGVDSVWGCCGGYYVVSDLGACRLCGWGPDGALLTLGGAENLALDELSSNLLGSLSKLLPKGEFRVLLSAGLILNTKISDLICNSSWTWPNEWFNDFVEVLNIPVPILNNKIDDRTVWVNRKGNEKSFSMSEGEVVSGIVNKAASNGIWSIIQRLTQINRPKIVRISADVRREAEIWKFPLNSKPKEDMRGLYYLFPEGFKYGNLLIFYELPYALFFAFLDVFQFWGKLGSFLVFTYRVGTLVLAWVMVMFQWESGWSRAFLMIEDISLENNQIVNIKESKTHPLENVIGNLNQRTLRSQAQDKSNFFCFISTLEPKNINEALKDENWVMAMQEELNQFKTNDVWELVPNPMDMTIIGTKWVYRNKLDENGVVTRNKARLVAQGYNQQEGIDYDETYAPVARLESIRILLASACALDFKLYQIDVKSAFLNGFINEEVYVAQPPGFIDFAKPNYVYKLKKALYGLKQASKA